MKIVRRFAGPNLLTFENDGIISRFAGLPLYRFDGRYLSEFAGPIKYEISGNSIQRFAGPPLGRFDGQYLIEFAGPPRFEFRGRQIIRFAGPPEYELDGYFSDSELMALFAIILGENVV